MTANKLHVVFIVGATATGKTAAALAIAERLPVEIVNADSRQVYLGMDIGTAKPTQDQRAAVPHHLIDVAGPGQSYSMALFLGQAREAVEDVLARGRLPLVVGGTGQYVWGLAEGWQLPQVPPQQELRERLEREAENKGAEALHRRLQRVDAAAVRLIDPRNVRRLIRALEVWEATGQRFSSQRRRTPPPFAAYVFGLWVPREELYRRIDARVDSMLEAGWPDEVRRLLDAGYAPELPSFSSAGYRELAAYVRGGLSWEEAVRHTKTAVHRLARRQGAWFRREDLRIRWLDGTGEAVAGAVADEVAGLWAARMVESSPGQPRQ